MKVIGRGRRRGGGLAMLVVVGPFGVGCGDVRPIEDDPIPAEVRAYARDRCLRIEQCACPNVTHGDRSECEARILDTYAEVVGQRDDVQLECFGEGAAVWRGAECDDMPDSLPCNAVTPSDDVGTPCRVNPFRDAYVHVDSCTDGLVCFGERCQAPVSGREPGGPCSPAGMCDPALTCIEGQCETPPMEGEACEVAWNCEPSRDLYCAQGVCTVRTGNGEACERDEECRLTVRCVQGACVPVSPELCLVGEV